jgi:hypothetical protein
MSENLCLLTLGLPSTIAMKSDSVHPWQQFRRIRFILQPSVLEVHFMSTSEPFQLTYSPMGHRISFRHFYLHHVILLQELSWDKPPNCGSLVGPRDSAYRANSPNVQYWSQT